MEDQVPFWQSKPEPEWQAAELALDILQQWRAHGWGGDPCKERYSLEQIAQAMGYAATQLSFLRKSDRRNLELCTLVAKTVTLLRNLFGQEYKPETPVFTCPQCFTPEYPVCTCPNCSEEVRGGDVDG